MSQVRTHGKHGGHLFHFLRIKVFQWNGFQSGASPEHGKHVQNVLCIKIRKSDDGLQITALGEPEGRAGERSILGKRLVKNDRDNGCPLIVPISFLFIVKWSYVHGTSVGFVKIVIIERQDGVAVTEDGIGLRSEL